jgi:hypothetical protein
VQCIVPCVSLRRPLIVAMACRAAIAALVFGAFPVTAVMMLRIEEFSAEGCDSSALESRVFFPTDTASPARGGTAVKYTCEAETYTKHLCVDSTCSADSWTRPHLRNTCERAEGVSWKVDCVDLAASGIVLTTFSSETCTVGEERGVVEVFPLSMLDECTPNYREVGVWRHASIKLAVSGGHIRLESYHGSNCTGTATGRVECGECRQGAVAGVDVSFVLDCSGYLSAAGGVAGSLRGFVARP